MNPVWSLSIRILILAGVLLGFATSTYPATAMPTIPSGTPLLNEGVAPCSPTAGVLKQSYDTDPGGQGGIVTFTVFREAGPAPRPFLVIIYGASGRAEEAKVYLELPGRGAQEMTFATLTARYAAPCEIVNQIVGSPS